MPNTPAMVLEGCTGACRNSRVTDEEMETCMKLLLSFGLAYEVPERLMDAVGAVSGSSPAFVFQFIEAMADGGVKAEGHGLLPRRNDHLRGAGTGGSRASGSCDEGH